MATVPNLGGLPPAPRAGRLQKAPVLVPTGNGSRTACHLLQPLLLSAPPLSFLRQFQGPSSPSGWGGGEGRGAPRDFPEQEPGVAVLGQRSREAGAPSQQAFMRAAAPPPLPCSVLPLPLPPRSAPRGGTQESHQLPPLSRGPAAPRASLDGSPAAVSSSSSSSSSSPSVNSSWPRP